MNHKKREARTRRAMAAERRDPPRQVMTVHYAAHDAPLCGFSSEAPAQWPFGHLWFALPEPGEPDRPDVSCLACRAARAEVELASEKTAIADG